MKFIKPLGVILLLVVVVFAHRAQANAFWHGVGAADFSTAQVDYLSTAFDSKGVIYVAYADSSSSDRAVVEKYDKYRDAWSVITTPFSTDSATYLKLAINPINDDPYLVFADGAENNQLTVMQYTGSSWQYVGAEGFTSGSIKSPSIDFDHSGNPYVAYIDTATNEVSVSRFDGTSWDLVGTAGFPGVTAYSVDLSVKRSVAGDVPYVLYKDADNNSQLSVMSFDGTNWNQVGTADFTAGSLSDNLPINANTLTMEGATPYVAFVNYTGVSDQTSVTVMKFDGSNWVVVGSPNIAPSGLYTMDLSLAIDYLGNPYVAFEDYQNSKNIEVLSYDPKSGNWDVVGPADFAPGQITNPSLAILPPGPNNLNADASQYDNSFDKIDYTVTIDNASELQTMTLSGSPTGNIKEGDLISGGGTGSVGEVVETDGSTYITMHVLSGDFDNSDEDWTDTSASVIGTASGYTNLQDTFSWSDDQGGSGSGVAITNGQLTLSHGVTVSFGSNLGHRLGDAWTFTASNSGISNLSFLGTGTPYVAFGDLNGISGGKSDVMSFSSYVTLHYSAGSGGALSVGGNKSSEYTTIIPAGSTGPQIDTVPKAGESFSSWTISTDGGLSSSTSSDSSLTSTAMTNISAIANFTQNGGGNGNGNGNGPQVGFLKQEESIYSGTSDHTVEVPVIISKTDGTDDYTVDYSTSNGTATAGIEYEASSGTLTFTAPNYAPQVIPVIIHGGLTSENKTFSINLSNVSNGGSYGQQSYLATIFKGSLHVYQQSDLLGQLNNDGSINFTKNTGGISATQFGGLGQQNGPGGAVAIDPMHHRLFVADANNARILVFALDSNNNLVSHTAEYVIGQSDPNAVVSSQAPTADNLGMPFSVSYDAVHDRLFVADMGFARVLVYDTSTITNGMSAIHVLGQTSLTAYVDPIHTAGVTRSDIGMGVGTVYDPDDNYLFVADLAFNRVLVYNLNSLTDGMDATYVIGHTDFTTGTVVNPPTQSSITGPTELAYDHAHHRLIVADDQVSDGQRVLTYDLNSLQNGMEASNVLGKSDFTTGPTGDGPSKSNFQFPGGVAYDEANQRLFVADVNTGRIEAFDLSSNMQNGENAENLLGQNDYTTDTGGQIEPQNGTIGGTLGIAYDSVNHRLYAFDGSASRVVIYNFIQITKSSLADGSVGTAYSDGVTSMGGQGVTSYAVTSGSLPAGLTLDSSTGMITGTPTVSGTSNFSITATDTNQGIIGGNFTDTRAYVVTIASPSIASGSTRTATLTGGKAYGYQPVFGSSNTPSVPTNAVSTEAYQFIYTLKFGTHDNEVIHLQEFLNKHGSVIATAGAGSVGHESNYLGVKTRIALAKFQKAHGLKADGVFGKITMKAVNQLLVSGN